jgi:hypothetical protein
MYKAYNNKKFIANNLTQIINKEKIIDINNDKSLDEKDKLTILLAYIPFI